MKIQRVQNLAFTGERRKFDVQAHIGSMYDGIHNSKPTYISQNIIDTVEINNVQKVLVSSISGFNHHAPDLYKSEIDCAKEINTLKSSDKVKLYPLLSCQPGIADNTDTISKLIDECDYYGLKFHPTSTNKGIKDNFEIYSKYMEVAQNKGLPCVFHSVTDGKSDPTEIIRLAEKYPKHPVVLYHVDLASTPEQMTKTIDNIANSVNSGKSNLFVDVSWFSDLFGKADENKGFINHILEKLGPDRVLFGSDAPIGEMGDKDKYKQFSDFIENTVKEFYKNDEKAGEKALDKIFYDNAEALFVEKKWFTKPQNIEQVVEKTIEKSNLKRNLLIGGGILALGAIGYAFKHFKQDNGQKSEVGN